MGVFSGSGAVGRSSSRQAFLVVLLILVVLGLSASVWWFAHPSMELATHEGAEDRTSPGGSPFESGSLVEGQATSASVSEARTEPIPTREVGRHSVASTTPPDSEPDLGTLKGQVLSADEGRVLPGAVLQVVYGGPQELARASCESDAEGRFELALTSPASLFVKITHAGYRTVVLPDVDRERELVLRLGLAGSLRGRLLDRRGNALVDREVQLWDRRRSRYRGPPNASSTTEVDGSFAFTDLDPGEFALGACDAVRPAVFLPGLLVRAGQELIQDLVLADGARIVGEVLTRQDRRPVEGATVRTTRMGPAMDDLHEDLIEHFERGTESDSAGGFELAGIGSGQTTLELRTPWGARLEKEVRVGAIGDAISMRLVVDEPASLSGFVRGPNDRPVPGASVAVAMAREASELEWGRSTEPDSLQPQSVLCGPDGSFCFEQLPARERLLLVAYVGEEWPEHSAFERSVSLRAGEERKDLVLRFDAGHEVSGRVFGGDRQPLEGVEVEAQTGVKGVLQDGPKVHTDTAGGFRLRLGGGDRLRLSFLLDGYGEERRWLRLPADSGTELHVELSPVSHLRGRVVDENGFGVVSVSVLAELQDGREKPRRRATRTDEWGLFEFEGLEPGTWTVEGSGPAYRPMETLTVTLPNDEWQQLSVRASLPPERAVLFGEVSDATRGEPIAGLSIDHLRGGVLRLDGARFEIFGFAPGRMSLLFTAPGMETMWVEQEAVAAGARIDLGHLEMLRATHLRVQVQNSAGESLSSARVRLRALPVERGGWPERRKRILLEGGAKGQYSARSVPRYSWRLEIDAPGYRRHREGIRVRGSKQELQVTLKPRK